VRSALAKKCTKWVTSEHKYVIAVEKINVLKIAIFKAVIVEISSVRL
jgi:hypothetical protein